MSFLLVLRIALRSLGRNKLRTWLAVLGVVIGVAAVTIMVSLGQSATQLIEGQLNSLGTNVLAVVPEKQDRTQPRVDLTPTDSDAIMRECRSVMATSPLIIVAGHVTNGRFHRRPAIAGVGADFLLVRNWDLAQGEFFAKTDIHSASKVCVLGHTVVVELFQTRNSLGQTVRIGNIPFRVIGVLESKGTNVFGQDQDDLVLLPFSTVRKRLQESRFNTVDSIVVSARSAEETQLAKEEIKQLMHARHGIAPHQPSPFKVADMKDYIRILEVVMTALTLTLTSIAGISLLVGGIGIMNIMLVSVTERTREIGLRMAVGANARDILRQFLLEAVVLSTMGGLVGLVCGIALSVGITEALSASLPDVKLPRVVSLSAAGIALLFAAAVGVFFGYYPAWRASRLDPIDALRYE